MSSIFWVTEHYHSLLFLASSLDINRPVSLNRLHVLKDVGDEWNVLNLTILKHLNIVKNA